MRCLHPSSEYFRFLDGLDASFRAHPALAAAALTDEFPALRAEEAKAVFCDWRAQSRKNDADFEGDGSLSLTSVGP